MFLTSSIKKWFLGLSETELFFGICIVGATIQIVYILDLFFDYETLTRVYVGVPEATILPDVSVCFSTLDMFNYTKMFTTYPLLLRDLGYEPETPVTIGLIKSIRNKFTEIELLSFLMERLKINQIWDQMISVSSVYDKAVTYIGTNDSIVQQPCSLKHFFFEQAYCYSFKCSNGDNSQMITGLIDTYKKLNITEVFTLSLHQSFFKTITSYWISLMDRHELPRGELIKWESQASFNVSRKHTFFFYSIETHLLREPYSTKCVDYSEKGYHSKAEMKDSCEIRLSLQYIGSPLPSNVVEGPINATFGYVNFENNKNNDSFIQMVSDIVDHCDQITVRPDCIGKIYVPSARTPLPIEGNYTQISIEQSVDPVYIISVEPRSTILDLIINIGAVLGTWLGFSVAYSIPQAAGFLGVKFFKFYGRQEDEKVHHKRKNRNLSISPLHLPGTKSYPLHRGPGLLRRAYNHRFPPLYSYYGQQARISKYNINARAWWL